MSEPTYVKCSPGECAVAEDLRAAVAERDRPIAALTLASIISLCQVTPRKR
jgi:hypothetical protein